jgi:hypothetical protein
MSNLKEAACKDNVIPILSHALPNEVKSIQGSLNPLI